jgi:RNA polymerase sigma-70 factor (ECF subfamily)
MTDRDLLRAYADRRDVDALGVFVGRYQDSLVRFVAGFLKDDGAAQDVVQETFLRVARQPAKLTGVDSPHNWLLRVARNLSVDYLRAAIRRRRHTREYAAERQEAVAVAEPATEALEREEVRERVRREIDGLSPRLRELMLLKVQEGKTYREIAEITGLSVTNVGYLLHRAMKLLAGRLKDMKENA